MTTTDNNYDSIITERARHFGRYDRHGGWIFAADVACCVKRGQGNGINRGISGTVSAEGKVSAARFAGLAGCSGDTVLRHLDAWELAAGRGLVPPADSLAPDSDPELPPAEDWEAIRLDPDGPFGRRASRRSDREQEWATEAAQRAQEQAAQPASRAERRKRSAAAVLADIDRDAGLLIRVLSEEQPGGEEAEALAAVVAHIEGNLRTARVQLGVAEPAGETS